MTMNAGPDHMTLFVSPYAGVELKSWSFLSGDPLKGPNWKNRSTYFVYYSYGSDRQLWNFWMEFEVRTRARANRAVVLYSSKCT